jgi:hypothetical protein
MCDMNQLALATDSTSLVTLSVDQFGGVPPGRPFQVGRSSGSLQGQP